MLGIKNCNIETGVLSPTGKQDPSCSHTSYSVTRASFKSSKIPAVNDPPKTKAT